MGTGIDPRAKRCREWDNMKITKKRTTFAPVTSVSTGDRSAMIEKHYGHLVMDAARTRLELVQLI
jgi:hypothetical protein